MKKIPTLFVREFDQKTHRIVNCTPEITPGCEEAFLNGIATEKIDGTCCAVIDGEFYKRYDAKIGKKGKKNRTPPVGAMPCCEPDPVTGHWPHWVKVDVGNPNDMYLVKAYRNYAVLNGKPGDGTYECIGPHIQGNPHNEVTNCLIRHGNCILRVERTFEAVKEYLRTHEIEGIVFWLGNEPVCKIKRSDFGFEWPIKREVDVND